MTGLDHNAMDFTKDQCNAVCRGIGDIENDIGILEGEIDDLESQLGDAKAELNEVQHEYDNYVYENSADYVEEPLDEEG